MKRRHAMPVDVPLVNGDAGLLSRMEFCFPKLGHCEFYFWMLQLLLRAGPPQSVP